MPQKNHRPEEIVAKFRPVDVLVSQRQSVVEAVRSIGVTRLICYRWRKEFGRLKSGQVKRRKDLQSENERLRKAISGLMLEKFILKEAAAGNFRARPPPRLHRPGRVKVLRFETLRLSRLGPAPLDPKEGATRAFR